MQSKIQSANIKEITAQEVASICSHAFLKRPEDYIEKAQEPVRAWQQDFNDFLEETVSFRASPYAVCVRPETVAYANDFIKASRKKDIVIASVVGFPHGSVYTTKFKLAEADLALRYGANEIDFVINYERLKQGDKQYVAKEMRELVRLVRPYKESYDALTKAVLETSELSEGEIILACDIAKDQGVDFVKTSTGYSRIGAKREHLRIIRKNFPAGIELSGGITPGNFKLLLCAASSEGVSGYVYLDPYRIRIEESGLLKEMFKEQRVEEEELW